MYLDNVEVVYNNNKLLARAMDLPQLERHGNELVYNSSIWANEFELLMNEGLSSASSTLLVPDINVKTYKNIGFLINSDLVNCFHIAKSDSGSHGNIANGDFFANKADFTSIEDLANYIKTYHHNDINEVNIQAHIDSVLGLFVNKCIMQEYLLQNILVVKETLKNLTGVEYPIYIYDIESGKIDRVELLEELEQGLIDKLKAKTVFYWTDKIEEPIYIDMNTMYTKIR